MAPLLHRAAINSVNLCLGQDVDTKHGGGPPTTSEIGCPLGVGVEQVNFESI